MALSHPSCSCPAASSIVFVSFLLATGAALWETRGLPFRALRRAMLQVHASVQTRCWRRALPGVAQTYTGCRQLKNLWSSLCHDPLSRRP